MKLIKYLIALFLFTFLFACKQGSYLQGSNVSRMEDGCFILHLGGDMRGGYVVTPLTCYKERGTTYLKGVVYEQLEGIALGGDSALPGVPNVNIYIGYLVKDSMHKSKICNCTLLTKSNCMGVFNISFVPSKRSYIIFDKNPGDNYCENTIWLSGFSIYHNSRTGIYKFRKDTCR